MNDTTVTNPPGGNSPADYTDPLPVVLKLLSCAAFSTASYPVFTAFFRIVYQNPASLGPWLLAAAAVMSGLLGCTAVLFLCRSALSFRRQVILLCVGGAAVFSLSAFLITPIVTSLVLARFVTGAICVWMYVKGCGFYTRKLKIRDIVSVVVTYLVSALALGSMRAAFSLTSYIWLVLGASVIMAAVFNYEGIDKLMTQSGRSPASLPPRIRAYNLVLLASFTLVLILLILLRQVFLDAGAALWRGVAFVLNALAMFVQGLLKDPEYNFNLDPNPGQTVGGSFQNYDLIEVLAGLVVAGIVLALILIIRKSAGRFIREKLLALLAAIRRALSKNFHILAPDTNMYYSDEEERLSGEGESLLETDSGGSLRRWKHDYRKFQKLPDGREKFIFGYRLSREGLRLHNVELPSSATPLEILERSRKTLPGPAYETATWCLNAMEYSPCEPKPAIDEMEETLSELKKR